VRRCFTYFDPAHLNVCRFGEKEYITGAGRLKLVIEDPAVNPVSLWAFESVSQNEKYVRLENWVAQMEKEGIQLFVDGIPQLGIRSYTHRFRFKLIDGVPHIGEPDTSEAKRIEREV